MSDELNLDIAPDGTVHGIESMNANMGRFFAYTAFYILVVVNAT